MPPNPDPAQLIHQIQAMQAQGLGNNQIIQTLQRDGYNATQIFSAMNQAVMEPKSPAYHPGETMQPNPQAYPPQPQPTYPQQPAPSPYAPPPQPPQQMGAGPSVEEMVEAVIDEKWNELVKDISTIIEWKNQAQTTITNIEQQFKDLKDQFDKLHQALIAKIGEYDKNILDVGAEVKAMEKVFSKVLPVFTENVAALAKITKEMKGSKPSKPAAPSEESF